MCYLLWPHNILWEYVFKTVFILQKRKLRLSKKEETRAELGLLAQPHIGYAFPSQSVVPRPAASAYPGSVLEIRSLKPRHGETESVSSQDIHI